ncbi:MAG TPA: hypothetical protein EYG73_12395 [Arcobacter sp.]|nr:hypothetical protein [Arcobacter sp.]
MASNLSQLFKEIIASTLETNLSKTVKVEDTIQVDGSHIKNLNLVSLDLVFDFDSVSIITKFLVPAYLSTSIFKTMMMEEGEPSHELDEDTPDAIKEVFGQVSGSLETAINGSEFEDLGTTKQQTVTQFEVIKGEEYSIRHKLIEFTVEMDEVPFSLYVDFEEAGLEYLEDINNSPIKEPEVEIIEEENEDANENSDESENEESKNTEEESINEDEKDLSNEEDSTDETENKYEESSTEESNSSDDKSESDTEGKSEKENEEDEKKQKKLKLLVMIVAGVLATVILTFTVLFFMGTFDPPPVVIKDVNKTVVPKQDILILDIKNKEIDFKIKMINSKRLNRRLAILTKYQILEEDVLEKYRKEEKERLYKLKMQRLEEFAANNKEESIFKKDINAKQSSNKLDRFENAQKDTNNPGNQSIIDSEKLTFIQISPLKYKTYKDIINKEKTKNVQISICKNSKGKIDVYIGPIYLNLIVNNIIKKVSKVSSKSKNDAKILIITRKEFNERCDF